MSAPPTRGQCPSCGSTVEFKVGSSRVAVCEYCRTAVARKGQDFTAVGKVADLIPTGSKLELGLAGRYDGHAFTLLGRVQMEWQGGVWDEWYARFDDGRWGWVSEAQGRYYVLFKVAGRSVPEREAVEAGQKVFFAGLGRFAVSDVKDATLASCAGELPDEIAPGSVARSADLEGAQQGFGTIDYGAAGDETQIFIGHEAALEELGLGPRSEVPSRAARPTGQALKCPHCNAPVELRVPEQTQHVVCASCNSLLDLTQGPLQFIEILKRYTSEPAIPLGSKGSLGGHDVLLVGWMQRTCEVDNETYPWDEYLLYRPHDTSFRWLLEQDGHWSLVEPISAGDIEEAYDISYRGRRFRRFSEVTGKVRSVLGEFYWQVRAGDEAELVDYVAPPEGISYEKAGSEVTWSRSTYMEPKAVAQAFNLPALAKRLQKGVAPTQLWPYADAFHVASTWAGVGMAVATLLFLGLIVTREGSALLTKELVPAELSVAPPETPDDPPPTDAKAHSYLSEPFVLRAHEPLEVSLSAQVSNSWAAASGAIINEATGDSAPFNLESEYYAGIDDGESWSEGSREASETLSALPAGTYVLRADLLWDPKAATPPNMRLTVQPSFPSPWQWLAAIALLALPFTLLFHRNHFESSRWWNSNVGSNASNSSGDDE